MHRIFLAFTWVVLSIVPYSATNSDEPVRIRVLSYNIHHAAGIDRKLDLKRIAGVILSEKPDLVALQEVDQRATRSGSVDQPAELARLTKMNVAFGGNIELQGGHYGNTILSRFPIMDPKNSSLPNVDNGEQRGVLAATISLPKTKIRLLATHFDHRRSDEERVLSAKAVNEMGESITIPAILAGDINDVKGSKTLKELTNSWTPTNDKPLPTIPVSQPKRQIDFIFYRPAQNWKVVETRVLDEDIASDHRAILSVLELTNK